MPGERTLYRKVQVVLDYAKEDKHIDSETLSDYIINKQPTNFLYYWRNKETDIIEQRYSQNSIKRVINICVELKLLKEEKMNLTTRGKSAIDPRRFPTIIGNSAKEFLETAGISIESILNAITSILRLNKPQPPTSLEIWNYLKKNDVMITREEFRRLLTLLGQCKILAMSQRRIFLPYSHQ